MSWVGMVLMAGLVLGEVDRVVLDTCEGTR
jgi:hypothetical protein